ncbi:cysteine hydrolase family protein [Mycoplasmopsis pullorum]|uniref:Isochorismatase n=1 Tax=Mycoplasmopsis pullorum TaxID=48003 RepID=A0A1L4FSK7_9BACT|nr:isochorismatase family cysteine hydrolase [Mycoplasmopsis pullorum]APJ38586.1 isochorismatase [Mycoplasmopsis pullorum]
MKTAIFVIDMLNGFSKSGALASQNVKNIIDPIVNYLDKKHNNAQVFFICDAHSTSDLEMNQYPIHCLKDSEEAKIVSELQRFQNSTIFYKNSTNAFHQIDTKIYDNFDSFELVGCCTDICVLQFALSLKTYLNHIHSDKKVIVWSNLCSTFDGPNHNAKTFHKFALELMLNAGIEVKEYV